VFVNHDEYRLKNARSATTNLLGPTFICFGIPALQLSVNSVHKLKPAREGNAAAFGRLGNKNRSTLDPRISS
jgi:hypothetical protein